MISLQQLDFAYPGGSFRLKVEELSIERGERVAIVGPSGSGKTTLLRLIAGMVAPTSGAVTTHGTPVSSLADEARRRFRLRSVGLVFQEFELLEYLSVLDNMLLPYHLDRSLPDQAEARARAAELANRVGLLGKLARLPDNLSQGERQRVAVCRALVTRPPLLLADEPTGNLDPRTGGLVLEELIDFAAEDGATLLVVTHDHSLLSRFERVIDVADYARDASPA